MKINNVELEDIDILDADVAEKYENALGEVAGIAKKVEGMKPSESIRTQCRVIFSTFNTLFGEGTDKKIFGDRVNLLICLKAFEELVVAMNSQKEEVQKLANKYSPNRAQKRAKK
ncbi:MAG: DUF6673 family protein [Clostridium sp.]|uniref:DUF6673 family protein n=1 Tax=Clostridium sp. TaxID=1506 RepID=UPI003D6D3996